MKALVLGALLIAACGGGAAGGGAASTASDTAWGEGPLASRPAEPAPPPSEWCGNDAGTCDVVPAGVTACGGVTPQTGEVGCCCNGTAFEILPIPGGPADPCGNAGVGNAQHPSCIEAPPDPGACGADGMQAFADWAPRGVTMTVACCCY